MPLSFRDFNFILGLRADKFLEGAKKAEQALDKTRDKTEKPFHLQAKVDNVIVGFAKVGLALDGLRRTYNLVLGPAKRMVELSNIQEKADTKLAAALKTRNLYTEESFKLLKDQASAIQSVTTSGDEQNEMLQALAINMGIAFEKTDEVTKGAIGLATAFADAGLSQEMALKGIALAYQGNFTQLQRYIPALRSVKDETKKMAVLQQAMTDGFTQAEAAAKDGAGQMEQFSNILGDVQEVGGDIIKDVLTPLLKILKPVLENIAGMDEGTRNTALAMTSFLVVGIKVPPMLRGIGLAVRGLYASIGPGGWLLLGLGMVVTLWLKNESATERATRKLKAYREEVDKLATADLRAELLKINLEIEETYQKMEKADPAAFNLWEAIKNGVAIATGNVQNFSLEITDMADKLDDLYSKKGIIESVLTGGEEPGPEAKTPTKKADLISKDSIDLAKSRLDDLSFKEIETFGTLAQVSTDFSGMWADQMEREYFHRSSLINDQLEMVENQYGEESLLYKQLMDKKWALEQSFSGEKKKLARESAMDTIAMGALLMDAFQGQSEAMFQIGKGASIAEALMNAYLAAQRAFRDYPYPFNIGISAINFALAYAQLKKISAVSYKPAGKAGGGLVTQADLFQSMFTPSGEDGIIGVRRDEFVMNQLSTRMFLPLLEAMNRPGSRGGAPGYQAGGQVQQPATFPVGFDSRLIKESIKEGFKESVINIAGTIRGDGRDLYLVVRKQEELEERRSL